MLPSLYQQRMFFLPCCCLFCTPLPPKAMLKHSSDRYKLIRDKSTLKLGEWGEGGGGKGLKAGNVPTVWTGILEALNKRILIFMFTECLSSYDGLLTKVKSVSLYNKRMQSKFPHIACIKVCILRTDFQLTLKICFHSGLLLMMISSEIIFCPSKRKKPETTTFVVLILFLTYQLSCGMRYLNLFAPLSLQVLKGESIAAFLYSRFSF